MWHLACLRIIGRDSLELHLLSLLLFHNFVGLLNAPYMIAVISLVHRPWLKSLRIDVVAMGMGNGMTLCLYFDRLSGEWLLVKFHQVGKSGFKSIIPDIG